MTYLIIVLLVIYIITLVLRNKTLKMKLKIEKNDSLKKEFEANVTEISLKIMLMSKNQIIEMAKKKKYKLKVNSKSNTRQYQEALVDCLVAELQAEIK